MSTSGEHPIPPPERGDRVAPWLLIGTFLSIIGAGATAHPNVSHALQDSGHVAPFLSSVAAFLSALTFGIRYLVRRLGSGDPATRRRMAIIEAAAEQDRIARIYNQKLLQRVLKQEEEKKDALVVVNEFKAELEHSIARGIGELSGQMKAHFSELKGDWRQLGDSVRQVKAKQEQADQRLLRLESNGAGHG